MNLLEYPHDIVSKVLTNWLSLNDVGRLDSAFCNICDRTHFLNLISSEGFVAKQTLIVPDMSHYLNWHIKRKVKTFDVLLNSSCSLTKSCLLFATIVGKHTECVEIRETKNALAVLMAGMTGEYMSLKRFNLVRCGYIAGLESFLQRAGPNLQAISIDTCTIDSDTHFEKMRLPKLKSLKLKNIHDVGAFIAMLHCCPQLEELVLQAALSTKGECLQKLTEQAHNLRRLTLWNCPSLTDTAAMGLAKQCPKLKDVKPAMCSLTDQAVIALTEHCPELESIALIGNFTDASLTAIATNCGPRLRCLSTINLGGENGLNALIENCPNLRSFKASNLHAAVHSVLTRLISSMVWLEEVALLNSTLNDDVLNAMGAKLRHLDLTGSQSFTPLGLANLALRCINLKTLYFSHCWELNTGMTKLWGHLSPELCFNSPNWTTPPYWKWE